MRTLLLSSVLCLMFFTCTQKDPLAIEIGECNEIFALDVALPSLSQPLIWLNDPEDNVVFYDEGLSAGGTCLLYTSPSPRD